MINENKTLSYRVNSTPFGCKERHRFSSIPLPQNRSKLFS